MKRYTAALTVLLPSIALAQPSERHWLVTTDMFGTPLYETLDIKLSEGIIIGTLDGDAFAGSFNKGVMAFSISDHNGSPAKFEARLDGDVLRGVAVEQDSNDSKTLVRHDFTAKPIPEAPLKPHQITFVPTTWSNEFSAYRPPVLTIWPGDTIHTTTIDSGGVDEHGITRALYGNPQTGPFFVGSANPGDVLAVHLVRLRLNRDYADSLDTIVDRAMKPSLAADAKALGKPTRWTLDRSAGLARPENATGGLKDYSIAVHPMLGCVAVAPGFGNAPFSTGDSGRYGGNMDFNGVVEGSTVYLQVQQPGALLYIGDAHAAQGDGETTQYGLETSMDVEFTVEVIHNKTIATPRVRSPDGMMALGFAGSSDDALKSATAGLVQWLKQDYGLTISEVAQILGSSLHYTVSEIADRNVGVVARIDDRALLGLQTTQQ